MLRRNIVKDTWDGWFRAETVAYSVIAETAPRKTVRISDAVGVGDAQLIEENNKIGLPCYSRSLSSPGESKKRRVPVSPVTAKKKQVSVQSQSASRPSLGVALEESFEESGATRKGRDWLNAPVLEEGYK